MKGGVNLNKKIIVPVVILASVTTLLLAGTSVLAQGPDNQFAPIIQKLAQKFNLNPADVQTVFDQQRQENISNRQTKFEDKLTQDVKDGKITEDQKNKILEKTKELQAQSQTDREKYKNMSPDERKTALQARKKELEDWASQNGIDKKYLFGFGRGFKMGMRAGWFH